MSEKSADIRETQEPGIYIHLKLIMIAHVLHNAVNLYHTLFIQLSS